MEVILPLLLTLPPAGITLIGLAISLSIGIVGLFFMVAYAMQNPQLVAVAREELAALVMTVLIIFFWVSMDSILNAISTGLVAPSLPAEMQSGGTTYFQGLANNHVVLALASLKVLQERLLEQYRDLYLFEALIGFLSTISFPIGSPFPAVGIISLSFAPFAGLGLLSNAHTTVVEAIGYLLSVLWAKEFILLFARDGVPLLLLPLGLVMRAIPFYRTTGSSIIALSVALYFVFPFSLLLTNYLLLDVFDPPDFAYTPKCSSFFHTERDQTYWKTEVEEAREGPAAEKLRKEFSSSSVVDAAYGDESSPCASNNPIIQLLCSVGNLVTSAAHAIKGFFSTIWNIWRFMMGFTGDFFLTLLNNPLMPESTSAGLYYFIIQEVVSVSPFLIIVTLMTVVEILLTLTMYRNVAMLIGGEAELIGIGKVV